MRKMRWTHNKAKLVMRRRDFKLLGWLLNRFKLIDSNTKTHTVIRILHPQSSVHINIKCCCVRKCRFALLMDIITNEHNMTRRVKSNLIPFNGFMHVEFLIYFLVN